MLNACSYAKITDQHFYLSVLQSLPEKQSHLDDTPLFVPPMSTSIIFLRDGGCTNNLLVTEPDISRPVFVHALKKCPRITVPEFVVLYFPSFMKFIGSAILTVAPSSTWRKVTSH
jgi:GINS complex subunit 4